MPLKIRLAVRDWDYLTPLIRGELPCGELPCGELEIEICPIAGVSRNFAAEHRYDAGEISFSRYVTSRCRGEADIVGVPNFVLRSFRHRCILTNADSPLRRLQDLAGKRIGLAGWQDTGSIWTRAALAHAGVDAGDVSWVLGRLTQDDPVTDFLEGFGRPGHIEAAGTRPLLELLATGALDAVFCPALPEGFFEGRSPFRQLLPDVRAEELAYFRSVGYVPGIHALGVKAPLAASHPWLPQALSDLIDASRRVWLEKRRANLDTTPWMVDELGRVARDLPAEWSASGLAPNVRMIADFAQLLHRQSIAPRLLSPAEIFPDAGPVSEAHPAGTARVPA